MGTAPGTKTVKKVSAPKTTKTSHSHPPYIQMITEALVALKERTGSSHHAIAKHIEEEQKTKDLPANFKKQLSIQLKKSVASGKLIMVKKSFKLPPKTATTIKSTAPTSTDNKKVKKPIAAASATAAKPKAVKKVAKDGKSKSLKPVKSPMKKKAITAIAKSKKPKSLKSPVKKVAVAAKKVAAKKAKK